MNNGWLIDSPDGRTHDGCRFQRGTFSFPVRKFIFNFRIFCVLGKEMIGNNSECLCDCVRNIEIYWL